jgi:hypothetical protein
MGDAGSHARRDGDSDDEASDPSAGQNTDDGGVEAPLPASPYAWADWPMPNPTSSGLTNSQAYTLKVDGVVTDSVTQLEWQQSADDELRTWDEATEYCAALALAGGGFRLPARIELLSLLDFTRANPSIDAVAFPDAPWDKFWSSSRFAGTRSSVWLVGFDFGTGFALKSHMNEKHRARCVR